MKNRLYVLVALLCIFCIPAWATNPVASFEPDSLSRIVAARQGRPFVLMMWSLECTYCMANLELLAREKKKRPDLDVVTISTDAAMEAGIASRIRSKLHSTGLKTETWGFGNRPPEQLRYAIDPKWHGEVPRTYIYDSQGQRAAYSGKVTEEHLEKALSRRP